MSEDVKIPKHWQVQKLKEITCVLGDGLHGTPKYSETGEYFFINGNNLTDGKIEIKENTKRVSFEEYEKYKKPLNEKTILVSINGTLGYTAFYKNEKVVLGKSACYFNVLDTIDKNYIRYYLTTNRFISYANKNATGSTIKNVGLKAMREIPIPIPPTIKEQQAIVSKIEELLSDLENGIQQLQTAGQQLKIYRQSLLKWAFDGKLTNKNVKDGELPEGWKWVKLGDVCNKIGDIDHKMPKQLPTGYPYVSTKDFTDDLKISFDKTKYISKEDYLNLSRKIKPERGDIIFPRYGTIGKNILIDFDKEFLVSYSCAVIKPNQTLVLSKYIYLYSLSPKVTEEIRKYTVETTQANVGIASIKSFVLPLPPRTEQYRIVSELESKLTVCDKLEETINQSLQQAETLRQSILKKAFEGKLV